MTTSADRIPVVQLSVDLAPWGDLDEFALLACQPYNCGNNGNWFFCFRGGWYGMRSRIWGFEQHYWQTHNWVPRYGIRIEHECHLASMLFHMDSSIECMIFAANALGNAFAREQFLDVSNAEALRDVSPTNVLRLTGRGAVPGYSTHFPRFTQLMRRYQPMIDVVIANHDVSKHRQMISSGGKYRDDPPLGFLEAYGIDPQDRAGMFQVAPMQRIDLDPQPKLPITARIAAPPTQPYVFEVVADLYARFMSATGAALLDDPRVTRPVERCLVLPETPGWPRRGPRAKRASANGFDPLRERIRARRARMLPQGFESRAARVSPSLSNETLTRGRSQANDARKPCVGAVHVESPRGGRT